MPLFSLGQMVAVNHRTCGTWIGEITYINDTGHGIEYEVSNSPEDMAERDPIFGQPGHRWFPLCWECELVLCTEGETK